MTLVSQIRQIAPFSNSSRQYRYNNSLKSGLRDFISRPKKYFAGLKEQEPLTEEIAIFHACVSYLSMDSRLVG